MKIGIAGFGVVGQAVYSGIFNKSEVVIYDKYKKIGQLSDLLATDFIFICLPTPTTIEGQDTSEIEYLFAQLTGYPGIVVIKSTILSLDPESSSG